MATKLTEWVIKLQENVGSKFQKINKITSVTNTKIAKITNTQKKFTQSVNQSKKGIGGLNSSASTLLGTLGAVAAIGIFKNLAQESLKLFDVQKKAEAAVLSSIQSTGGAAGRTIEQLKKQASDLQGVTLFGDEETLKAQSILLTFTKISGEIFDKTIPLAQDLATKFGGDLRSASVQLGKALNDPVVGLTALSRSGITFSESQKKMIKGLVQTNQLSKAQNVILNELQTQFGGASKAAALAGLGGFTQLGNSIGDIQEQFGELIFNIMPSFNKILKPVLSGVSSFFDLVNGNQLALDIIQSLVVGLGAAAVSLGVYKIITIATTAVQWLLNASLTANPIGLVVVGIGALIAAITLLWQRSETFRGIVLGLWEVFKTAFGGIYKLGVFVFTKLKPVFERFSNFVSTQFNGITHTISRHWNTVMTFFRSIAKWATKIFNSVSEAIEGVFTFDFSKAKSGLSELTSLADDVGKSIPDGFKEALNMATDIGKKVPKSFKIGFDKGVGIKTFSSENRSLFADLFPKGKNPLAIGDKDNAGIRDGLNQVSSGGSQVRNVSVIIQEVIGIKDLSVQNAVDSIDDLAEQIKEVLVRSIGGAEQTLG